MYRIDNITAAAALPAPLALGTPGFFTGGNPATATPATIVDADWLNALQEEIAGVIEGTGGTLNKSSRLQLLAALQARTRTRCTGVLNLYVSPAGNDASTGLSTGTALATPQGAWNRLIANYDLAGFGAQVNLAAGTYPAFICQGRIPGQVYPVAFLGNTLTPSSVIIASSLITYSIGATDGADVQVGGMQITNSNGSGIVANGGGVTIAFNNVVFAPCLMAQQWALNGGIITCNGGTYSISGGGQQHAQATLHGSINFSSCTINLSGTPAYSGAFASAGQLGVVQAAGAIFSGAASGPRYSVATNGLISVSGAGATFLPGSTAGAAVDPSGLYI